MPRSAANRKFGYRSPALVRILTSADADEVLTALEILGISPERPETLEQALENVVLVVVEQVVAWVGPLNDLIDVVTTLDGMVASYSQERDPSPLVEQIRVQTNTVRAIAIRSMEGFKQIRDDFTTRMLAAKVQNPTVAWPEMPGIDPQL